MANRKQVAEVTRLMAKVHGDSVSRANKAWAESLRERVLGELAPQMERFDARVAEVDADSELSVVGKARALNALRAEARASVEGFRKATAGTILEQVTRGEAALVGRVGFKPASDPTERAAQEARAKELRDSVRGLDPLNRFLLYSTADSQGDLFTTWALESGPRVVDSRPRNDPQSPGAPYLADLVDGEKVAEMRLARVRREHPEEAEKLRDLQGAASAYAGIADAVLVAIGPDDGAPAKREADRNKPLTGDPQKDVLLRAGLIPTRG